MTTFHVPTPGPLPTPKKSATGKVILALTAFTVVGVMLGTSVSNGNVPGPAALPPAATTSSAPAPVPTPSASSATPTPTPTETETYDPTDPDQYRPKKSDVALTLKKTRKACFGSAGCLVTVRVQAAVDFSAIPDTGVITVYYKITGDEDGPTEDTVDLDLDSGEYYQNSHTIGIPGRSEKGIKIKVTDIEYTE